MTFKITLDNADDLIVEDYLAQTDKGLATVAHHSIINMISNDYADAAAYERAMEEYRKNPGDVCTHAELMQRYGLA